MTPWALRVEDPTLTPYFAEVVGAESRFRAMAHTMRVQPISEQEYGLSRSDDSY